MKGIRTNIDFSNHELLITDHDDTKIYWLKKPDTMCDSIKYIASGGILAVTGDYSNWIFDKEFRPDVNEKVDDGYWNGKLKMSSCQDPYNFDSEETKKYLRQKLAEYKEDHTVKINSGEEEEYDEVIEYYETCIEKCDEHELDYTHYAYREQPSSLSYEDVVILKEIKHQLKAVYDGFDEMHRRLNDKK